MEKTDKSVSKKWVLYCGIVFAVIYSLNCFVISPVTSFLLNDVIYSDSVFPTLLGYINELLELVAISFCYAVLILTLYICGRKRCAGVFVVFVSFTLYKYVANTAVAWILDGSVPSLWGWDVVNVFYYTALELLQIFIIYLFAKSIIKKYTDKRLAMERALEKLGEEERASAVNEEVYPFKRVFDMSNCLLKSAFVCAVVIFVAKLFGALVSDVWLIIVYGAPKDAVTWLYMLLNYLSRIIIAAIAYLAVFISMTFLMKNTKSEK